MALRIATAVGIILVIAFIALQVRAWRSGALDISARQKKMRVVTSVIMVLLLTMLLISDWIIAYAGPLVGIIYWLAFVVLLATLPFVALVDMIESRKRWRQQQANNVKSLIYGTGGQSEDGEDGRIQ